MSVRAAETDQPLSVALKNGSAVEHAQAEQSAHQLCWPVLGSDDCCGSQAHW
jgi:hypothetical protein